MLFSNVCYDLSKYEFLLYFSSERTGQTFLKKIDESILYSYSIINRVQEWIQICSENHSL